MTKTPLLLFSFGSLLVAQPARDTLGTTIRPYNEKNFQQCHNDSIAQDNIDLQQLVSSADSFSKDRLVWQQVLSAVRDGEMPPKGMPRPPQNDVTALMTAVNAELEHSTAPVAGPSRHVGSVPATRDWLTFSYDPERTGWARGETKLTKGNVHDLGLVWKAQLDAVPNIVNVHATITDALVVNDVQTRDGTKNLVIVAGGANEKNAVYALDSATGKLLWQKNYPNNKKPPQPPNGACPNNMNATPVIDKSTGTVYILPTDGKVRGVGVADGEDKMPATRIVAAFSRNYSLNLVDGQLYATTTRGCAAATSEVAVMDVRDSEHPVQHFYTSPGKGSGVWGRGAIVKSPWGVLAQTADGAFDPGSGRWGNSVLQFTSNLRLMDSYTPANEEFINKKDFDLGSGSPLVFDYEKWTLIAVAAKEGVIYLLDAASLGGKDHRTPLYLSPRWSNDAEKFGYNGMWGAMGTYVDAQGQRWLLAPMMGPAAKDTLPLFKKQHGNVVNGSLMAFKVETKDGKPVLTPEWISGDLDLPGVPVIANGVVYVLADGDRGVTLAQAARGGGRGGRGGRGGAGRGAQALPLTEVNPEMPGYERDAAWREMQLAPGGQESGTRYSGGRDTTHAVLYALDGATGDELYSSGDLIDSWNHYGGLALSNGQVHITTYAARVFAFGLKK